MANHVVGSYNMSFVSDLGKMFGSEKHFIHNGTGGQGGRQLWENAALFVRQFWDLPDASVVGLQEMNMASKTGLAGSGIERIYEILSSVPNLAFQECSIDVPKIGSPTLLTVWNHVKLGPKSNIYCNDIGTFGEYAAIGPMHLGRPISIIQTAGGYTLINLHAPNLPADSLAGCPILRRAIQHFVSQSGFEINPDKVFVMGDFNDPHNAIKSSSPLVLNEINLNHSTTDKKTLSCCYNFNSSCEDDLYNPTDAEADRGDGLIASPRECFIKRVDDKAVDERLSGNARSLGQRGELKNYKFTGDYVLGQNIVESLSIFRPTPRPVSLESDHEFVIATFSDAPIKNNNMRRGYNANNEMGQGGGRRKKTRKNRNKKRNTKRRR
jgi:hypothetical protein